jgi:hypothetical protein
MTGIKLSAGRVLVFMHRIGMKCSKSGHIPAKADVEEQAVFKRTRLDPLIKLAEEGKAHLFFMNSAHFILQPFICTLQGFFFQRTSMTVFLSIPRIHAVSRTPLLLTTSVSICAFTERLQAL